MANVYFRARPHCDHRTRRAAHVPHPARSGEIQAETQPYCVLLGVGLPDCW